MAIKQTNIFPLDKQPRKAVGVKFPFSEFAVSGSGATPFKSNYTTADQIKSNLAIYFTTNPGERPLNPNYGGGLSLLLFEQLNSDTFENVKKIIGDSLAIYFPEVELKKLEVFEGIENNTLKVVMSYTVFNNPDTLELNFNA